ncbi:uncharacterized protein K452DRAFT_163455 [Aplosporella prunicola CBS 121167]|uniref:Uncharacterized protein n=1 Tax=Aplosporella prunicola CBS 121167 TaxID=1176127 RepID=A0A6A6BIA1_9PEZI|nr:uncharacterized protein K452DRAFT_163455 [Aplosporella prunicola CBS 121167]KAF2143860.1 hypothetical protein K452DRAFT_163455 [Aplosporella prunicola CBS 121167]
MVALQTVTGTLTFFFFFFGRMQMPSQHRSPHKHTSHRTAFPFFSRVLCLPTDGAHSKQATSNPNPIIIIYLSMSPISPHPFSGGGSGNLPKSCVAAGGGILLTPCPVPVRQLQGSPTQPSQARQAATVALRRRHSGCGGRTANGAGALGRLPVWASVSYAD